MTFFSRMPECGCVLMLHHVAPIDRSRLCVNDAYRVSPEFLERTIRDMRRKGFAFLSMDEVAEVVRGRRTVARFAALTFDDGYADNFSAGAEVLRSENVPGMVYLAPGLASGDGPIWWDALEDHLLSVDCMRLPDGTTVRCDGNDARCDVFLRLCAWVRSLPPDEVAERVAELCGRDTSWFDAYRGQMATAETIRGFSGDRLVSLGCHTHRHISCGGLPDRVVEEDVRRSLSALAGCGVSPRHFAFPYGDDLGNTDRLDGFFESCGFRSAVVTVPGVVVRGFSNVWRIPRVMVSEYERFSARRVREVWRWQRERG